MEDSRIIDSSKSLNVRMQTKKRVIRRVDSLECYGDELKYAARALATACSICKLVYLMKFASQGAHVRIYVRVCVHIPSWMCTVVKARQRVARMERCHQ